jgi:hypothetical protein
MKLNITSVKTDFIAVQSKPGTHLFSCLLDAAAIACTEQINVHLEHNNRFYLANYKEIAHLVESEMMNEMRKSR